MISLQSLRNESGRDDVTISRKYIVNFKKALGLEDVPLTNDEVAAFKKNLLMIKKALYVGDIDLFKESQLQLAHCVKWSHEPDLQITYLLLCILFYRIVGDNKACDETMLELGKRRKEFTEEHLYVYKRQLGVIDYLNYQYNDALAHYLEAQKVGEPLDLCDPNLFFNIGLCLYALGYAYMSCRYFEKALDKGDSIYQIKYGIRIQKCLAGNYSQLGQHKEALKVLRSILKEALEKKVGNLTTCAIYAELGRTYRRAGNCDKALENIDNAFRYYDEGSEIHIYHLCDKAYILFTYNRYEELRECIKAVFSMIGERDGPPWHTRLISMEKLMRLHDTGCRVYLETVLIPKHLKRGDHLFVIECYERLALYYESIRHLREALDYTRKASELRMKLIEEDFSI